MLERYSETVDLLMFIGMYVVLFVSVLIVGYVLTGTLTAGITTLMVVGVFFSIIYVIYCSIIN